MKSTFTCPSCNKEVSFSTEKPTSIHKNAGGYMTTEDVTCPSCEDGFTVECYFDHSGYLGCQAFEYGWYMEHRDEEFTVNL